MIATALTAHTSKEKAKMQTPPATTTDVLVGAEWLESHLTDPSVRIVEVDVSSAPHAEGHIPGSVLWNIYRDIRNEDYQLRPTQALEDLIRRSGITTETTVVCYGYAPALGYWLLRLFGHNDVRILNTSRATWSAEGRPWTSEPAQTEPSAYEAPASPHIRAELQAVLEVMDEPGHTIFDVRSDLEYVGERFWPSGGAPDGGRAGHIPNAVHLSADGVVGPDGAFRPMEELRRLMAVVEFDAPAVIYCTVGARAATVWFILTEMLGHPDVRVYDGSWAEWGMDPAVPIVTGP